MRTPSVLIATILCLVLSNSGSVAKAHTAPYGHVVRSTDVSGDDSADRYVGTGGLVLPGSVDTRTRHLVAECSQCWWRLSKPCAAVSWGGCTFDPNFCPDSSQILRTWLSQDSGVTWRNLGLVCIGPGGPVTVAQVGASVTEGFERDLPPSRIRYEPARGVLPYLPVVFHSGQPQSIPPTEYLVAGQHVVLNPIVHWRWDFGDGSIIDTDLAGSSYPDDRLSHAYRNKGEYLIQVTTTWTATYLVDGMGPFDVTNPVYQRDTAMLRIGQARALLTR